MRGDALFPKGGNCSKWIQWYGAVPQWEPGSLGAWESRSLEPLAVKVPITP